MDKDQLLKVAMNVSDSVSAAASMSRTKAYAAGIKEAVIDLVDNEVGDYPYAVEPGATRTSWAKGRTISEALDALQGIGYLQHFTLDNFADEVGKPNPGRIFKVVDRANELEMKKTKFNENVLEWMNQQVNDSDLLSSTCITNSRATPKIVFDRELILRKQSLGASAKISS